MMMDTRVQERLCEIQIQRMREKRKENTTSHIPTQNTYKRKVFIFVSTEF